MLKFLDYFRNARDWKKFHTSKNLSMAIGSESGELIDLFLWDREKDVDEDKVKNELADIVTYCLYLANNYGIDLFDAVIDKTIENDKKYPVDKAKGSAKKYNKLG
jgi:NTP pyrophosphatase (non-canonical NTP hydrolase)